MPVHTNSRRSYAKQKDKEPTRAERILRAFARSCRYLTDRNVANRLGFSDMNAVRPTLTRLVQNGTLHWVGTQTCPITGRPVRVLHFPN